MKEKFQNGMIYFVALILSFAVVMTILFLPQLGRDEIEQQMIFGTTLLFFSLGIVWVIIKELENKSQIASNKMIIPMVGKKENAFDITSIDAFLKNEDKRKNELVQVLKRIKEYTEVLSSQIHEFDFEQQHHMETMINQHLRKLLSHYNSFVTREQQTTEQELMDSLLYIEHQLKNVYIKELDERSIQQFRKTRKLLHK